MNFILGYKWVIILQLFAITAFSQSNPPKFKFENNTTIVKFLQENQLQCSGEDLFIFKTFEDFYKFNAEGFLKGPVVHVFDKNGNYLEAIAPEDAVKKMSNFNKIKSKPKKDGLNIESWLDRLVNSQTLEAINRGAGVDYYFVINWAIFFNKPEAIKAAFEWYDVLKRQQQKGENIQIVLLDMDLQDSWGLSEEKKDGILKQANK